MAAVSEESVEVALGDAVEEKISTVADSIVKAASSAAEEDETGATATANDTSSPHLVETTSEIAIKDEKQQTITEEVQSSAAAAAFHGATDPASSAADDSSVVIVDTTLPKTDDAPLSEDCSLAPCSSLIFVNEMLEAPDIAAARSNDLQLFSVSSNASSKVSQLTNKSSGITAITMTVMAVMEKLEKKNSNQRQTQQKHNDVRDDTETLTKEGLSSNQRQLQQKQDDARDDIKEGAVTTSNKKESAGFAFFAALFVFMVIGLAIAALNRNEKAGMISSSVLLDVDPPAPVAEKIDDPCSIESQPDEPDEHRVRTLFKSRNAIRRSGESAFVHVRRLRISKAHTLPSKAAAIIESVIDAANNHAARSRFLRRSLESDNRHGSETNKNLSKCSTSSSNKSRSTKSSNQVQSSMITSNDGSDDPDEGVVEEIEPIDNNDLEVQESVEFREDGEEEGTAHDYDWDTDIQSDSINLSMKMHHPREKGLLRDNSRRR